MQVPVPTFRVFLFLVGLLAMLAVVACDMESYDATKAVEDATETVEKAFDEQRKSVDDLPNCKDARDDVYAVEWKNRGNGRGYLSKIEDYRTVSVEVSEFTATITCAGEAWRRDGRYIGEVTYWSRKNKNDADGTRYAGYDVGVPQSKSSETEEPTATIPPTPTVNPTPPASFATRMAKSNATKASKEARSGVVPAAMVEEPASPITTRPDSTESPIVKPTQQPTPTPEIQQQEWIGTGRTLLMGGTGEDGLAPGTYEYRDYDGGAIVTGLNCSLHVNYREQQEWREIPIRSGLPFTFKLEFHHNLVHLDGRTGPYHDGCTNKIVSGEGLYRVGD